MTTIGIDYTSAVQQFAGIGRYTREIVAALAARDAATRYRLFVAAGGPVAKENPGPNFEWRTTRLSRRWLERLWYRLRLPLPVEVWAGRFDLFHQPDFVLPPVLPGVRTIVTIHDLSFVRQPDSVMPGMGRYLNTWVPRSVAQADHVIAVSEATRQDVLDLYGAPPEKVSVIYHGVRPQFQPVTEPARLAAVRQKYGLGQAPVILSVGTVQPRKNYRRLIQAFARLEPTHTLVIAGGKGWQYQAILAEADKPGLAGRVHFPDFVADEDLPALYSAADLFVYPSLYEGFGLPALEAMACGAPVVCSNSSSLPEVVGKAAILVDPLNPDAIAAAMQQVLADTAWQQKMGAAGQAQAAHFTWDGVAAQLQHLYRTILEKR
jgi:glycosyltransferase involved in cell wall biosynthesis